MTINNESITVKLVLILINEFLVYTKMLVNIFLVLVELIAGVQLFINGHQAPVVPCTVSMVSLTARTQYSCCSTEFM